MKLRLIRDARIAHKAGEVVNTTPAEGAFLISVGSAVEIVEKATAPAVEVAEEAVKVPKAATTVKKSVPKTIKRGK